MVDLSVTLCGVRLPNQTVVASGILGLTHGVFVRVARAGAGAVTTKSISLTPRDGYPNLVILEWDGGLINAVGLSNPGVEVMADEIGATREQLTPLGVPIIASIFADTIYDFGTIARHVSEARPDLVEVNISCANIDDQYLQLSGTDIVRIAGAVVEAGADSITAVNSLGPGLILDIETASPILSHGTGGVSGPALRPIAVCCVYDICRAMERHNYRRIDDFGGRAQMRW